MLLVTINLYIIPPRIINYMKWGIVLGIIVLFLSFSLSIGYSSATWGPRVFLEEQVFADYDTDGTNSSDSFSQCQSPDDNPCRMGYVDVSVPNDFDTLQYIRVNLSTDNLEDTDIANHTSYKNVLTSYPTAFSKKKMDVNTTNWGESSNYYNITNITEAPEIRLNLSYGNAFGGTDLYDSDNVVDSSNHIEFNLTILNPSTDVNLSDAYVGVQFDIDSGGGGEDLVNISLGSNSSTSGTNLVVDSDTDTYYDRITWTGNLTANTPVYLTFNATFTEGTNVGNGVATVYNFDTNTSDKGAGANYTGSSTFTGLTVSDYYSKGPIRQGIDLNYLEETSNWQVRGFIRNMANETPDNGEVLTYNVTEWGIYEISPVSGEPYPTSNQSGKFNQTPGTTDLLVPSDGRIYTTEKTRSSNTTWFSTGSETKPYFSVYFDWHVLWNTTDTVTYTSFINTTLDLPTLYIIDMSNNKNLDGIITPDTGDQVVTITDNATHLGNTNAKADQIEIISVVPANTTGGLFHGWFDINQSSVKAYFVNSTDMYEINTSDDEVTVTVTEVPADGSYSGFVNVTINDTSLVGLTEGIDIGHDLDVNEYISLTFDCISNATMTTGDSYNFTGNTTMTTPSGTPITENHPTSAISISAKRLMGYKSLVVLDPSDPTAINVTIVVSVDASTGENITGIKFLDYVFSGLFDYATYRDNLSVTFWNGAGTDVWVEGTDYDVTDNGTVTLSDGTSANAFEIINASGDGTFTLFDNQSITVRYLMNVTTSGSYILPVELLGIDPLTGESFRTLAFGAVRVDIPEPLTPLQITENDLSQAKRILVGKPGLWIKSFEVYNPNARRVESNFRTLVFKDTTDAHVTYYDVAGQNIDEFVIMGAEEEDGRLISWKSSIDPFETRSYEIRVMTPAVLEIDRDVEVLEKMEGKRVKLKMDIYLKNFAQESYENLILNLPIPYENIMEVRDGFGNRLPFTGGADSSTITVESIDPDGLKTVSVIYSESYPTIIITPDRDRYDLNSPVSLDILVINGGDDIEYPFMEIDVYTPGMDVIFSNIEKLDKMEALEKTELYQKFNIPATAPTGMYIASAKFREDFTTLASTTGYFFVSGTSGNIPEAAQILMVIIITALLIYFSAKRLKEVRKTRKVRAEKETEDELIE